MNQSLAELILLSSKQEKEKIQIAHSKVEYRSIEEVYRAQGRTTAGEQNVSLCWQKKAAVLINNRWLGVYINKLYGGRSHSPAIWSIAHYPWRERSLAATSTHPVPPPAQKYTDPSVGLFSLPSISLVALSLVFSFLSVYFALLQPSSSSLLLARVCSFARSLAAASPLNRNSKRH